MISMSPMARAATLFSLVAAIAGCGGGGGAPIEPCRAMHS
jgi:hypothetical protein